MAMSSFSEVARVALKVAYARARCGSSVAPAQCCGKAAKLLVTRDEGHTPQMNEKQFSRFLAERDNAATSLRWAEKWISRLRRGAKRNEFSRRARPGRAATVAFTDESPAEFAGIPGRQAAHEKTRASFEPARVQLCRSSLCKPTYSSAWAEVVGRACRAVMPMTLARGSVRSRTTGLGHSA